MSYVKRTDNGAIVIVGPPDEIHRGAIHRVGGHRVQIQEVGRAFVENGEWVRCGYLDARQAPTGTVPPIKRLDRRRLAAAIPNK